jgi:hypothetical protein
MVILMFCVSLQLLILVALFQREDLVQYFYFDSPLHPWSFWNCLWAVSIADFATRFVALFLKALAFMISFRILKYPNTVFNPIKPPTPQPNALVLIEAISSLTRYVAPVPVWYVYFIRDGRSFVSSLTAGAYLALKLGLASDVGRFVSTSFNSLCFPTRVHGPFAQPLHPHRTRLTQPSTTRKPGAMGRVPFAKKP